MSTSSYHLEGLPNGERLHLELPSSPAATLQPPLPSLSLIPADPPPWAPLGPKACPLHLHRFLRARGSRPSSAAPYF